MLIQSFLSQIDYKYDLVISDINLLDLGQTL